MGSICSNFKKERWNILREGHLKSNGRLAYIVEVGAFDDYGGRGCLTVTMLKEVYDKIMRGEYTFISQPYSETPILIVDMNNNKINPLEDCITVLRRRKVSL